jgi:hypothetical protein
MPYIIALFLLLAIFCVGCALVWRAKKSTLVNIAFVLLVYSAYLFVSLTVYFDVGFSDWNFQNTLPTANVSPFMFTLAPLSLLLPRKPRRCVFLLISMLSFGMLLAGALGCVYNAVIGYKFHFHFFMDYTAHILLSLFGVYLVRSEQVDLTPVAALISGSVIFGSALLMLILNLIFDTSFFGLSLSGKHNIYNVVLTDNSYISALLYFIGLSGVLVLGYFACIFIKKAGRTKS